jgi:MFS family permease
MSAFLANFAYAEQFNSTYGVFVYHVGAEMGWGRSALGGVKAVARLPEALMAVFIGPFVDRYGGRWFIVGGGIVVGLCFILASTVAEIWQLYAYMAILMPLGSVCLGGFVTTVVVSNWFVSKRGRAIGIVGMGTSVSTMLLPLASSAMIESWGWRAAWAVMGIGVMVLVIPAALFVRRRPEDIGLHPDGLEATADAAPVRLTPVQERRRERLLAADVVWSRSEVLRSPTLWAMVFAWGIAWFSVAGTNLHMVAFFLDLHYPLAIAAAAVSFRSAMALVANPMWGYLVERFPVKLMGSLQFSLAAVGIAMWLLPPSPATLIIGLILFGFGNGGSQVVAEVIWAEFFGRISLGTVRSVSYPLQTAFSALGPVVMGLMYDTSGSYQSSFVVMVAGSLLAAGLVQLARPPRRRTVQAR